MNAKIFKEDVVRRIGRELTEHEKKTIEWLCGWEKDTVNGIYNLISAAHNHGKAFRDS